MDVQIRKVELSDAPAIAELLRAIDSFAHMREEPAESTVQRIAQHLQLYVTQASHSAYVAETPQHSLAGYVAAHWLPYLILAGPEGFVSELFIDESARGQGIGARLLDTVAQEARRRGCSRLQLINMRSRESYQRGFYTKQGWQERTAAADFIYVL